MNIDNNDVLVDTADSSVTPEPSLDDFEKELFSGTAPEQKPEEIEEPEQVDEPSDEDTDDFVDPVDDNTDDEEDDSDTPKKETRAEKRIRELNSKFREEERKRIELEKLLEERSKKSDEPEESKEPKPNNKTEDKTPHWDDEDENGHKLYPLGQFDPKFNADLVAYTVRAETQRIEEQKKQEESRRQVEEAQRQVQEQWEEKLTPARERYPDFQEKGETLINQFADLEPTYAQYLTDTIRSIDNGPDVLYHLANDLELANEIVRKGPAAATIALGRISALLDSETETPTTPTRTKVTNAPPPPPRAKGSAAPRTKNPLDNLDDFEEVFFKRK